VGANSPPDDHDASFNAEAHGEGLEALSRTGRSTVRIGRRPNRIPARVRSQRAPHSAARDGDVPPDELVTEQREFIGALTGTIQVNAPVNRDRRRGARTTASTTAIVVVELSTNG
jgi:hypothetical protein